MKHSININLESHLYIKLCSVCGILQLKFQQLQVAAQPTPTEINYWSSLDF
jgi:hypothetical protein